MTEEEWLACTEPTPMLEFLRGPLTVATKELFGRLVPIEGYRQQRISQRKARLFVSACCRRLWPLLDDAHCKRLVEMGKSLGCFNSEELQHLPLDSCRKAVELAERSADESVGAEELRIAWEAADAFHVPPQNYVACYSPGIEPFDAELVASGYAAYAAYYACLDDPGSVAVALTREAAFAVAYLRGREWRKVEQGGDATERAAHCGLLRDIVDNPFRPASLTPSCLTPTVTNLATTAYNERTLPSGELDSVRLAVLADALEEAGCSSADLLSHLRSVGPHVRGCWPLDLLMGKE